MTKRTTRRRSSMRGATAIEYALIASLVAVAAYLAMAGLGNEVADTFNTVEEKVRVAPG